jgi:hypothetical protein
VNAFLQELGQRLADRWLTYILIPGLLFAGAVLAASALGHAHALDAGMLVNILSSRLTAVQHRGNAGLAVVLAVLALGSSGAALAARLLGNCLQRLWLSAGDRPVPGRLAAGRLAAGRLRRWEAAASRYATAVQDGADRVTVDLLAAKRNAIALAPPSRPTWIGDRLAAVDARLLAEYELDLSSAWPRLWLVLPDNTRADLRTAASSFDSACSLGGWAALYFADGLFWWPGLLVSIGCGLACVQRAREAAGTLADLIEAAVDLYTPVLCAAVHITAAEERLTPGLGRQLTRVFRKGA